MARASTVTLLSLSRYARILGINPLHFSGAAGAQHFPTFANCGEIYPQFAWQQPESIVSREELAYAIFSAEQDIKRILGYSPAPQWECGELHHYEANRRYVNAPIKVRFGELIAGGRRAVTELGEYPVVYADFDTDGFTETATVVVPLTAVTDIDLGLLDACETKVYFRGKGGAPNWEIRSPRSVVDQAGSRIFTFDSWLFIKPELTHAITTPNGFQPVDADDLTSYVATVDVYREYNDVDGEAAVIYPTGSEWQATTSRLALYNRRLGFVSPAGGLGSLDAYCNEFGRNALDVELWYYAGKKSCDYGDGISCDPLNDYWAQTIAWMATARLDKPLCACTNVQEVARELQRNTARDTERGGNGAIDYVALTNPFGTRVGELRGWHRTMNMNNEQIMDAGVF